MLKTERIEITEGRDTGKVFLVEEMPVSRLEKWCARALIAMLGADIPADVAQLAGTSNAAALVQVFQTGLKSLRWQDAEPLYDDLLPQIYVLPQGQERGRLRLSPGNIDAHVQDLKTIFRLRMTVLELSLGFSFGEGR